MEFLHMDPFQKRKLNVVLRRLYAMGAPKAGDLHVGRAMASALFVQFNVEYSCVSYFVSQPFRIHIKI